MLSLLGARLVVRVGVIALIAGPIVIHEHSKASDGEEPSVSTSSEPRHTNRLIHATSPYLLQHVHNPVDWFEWGEEAFAAAKKRDKPIFLSIGYSACHWCHVMAHESFEAEEVAHALNGNFVSIKVDREERPDIDEIFMAYTQARTGGGGWPMSVWLTPDGTPFFAGTYFPKHQLLRVLWSISEAWENQRDDLLSAAKGARAFLSSWSDGPQPAEDVVPVKTVNDMAKTLSGYFDHERGGMRSSSNKFPPSMAMDLMLRVYHRTGDAALFEAVEVTLDHMARGGIYDHIGGGICRYSTDPDWLVPHFEKMLYDQGMVSAIFLDAYQVCRKPLYARIAGDIFDYVITDLQSPEGGFYSARDADSGGLEGAFYIWTVDEIHSILGEEEGELFCAYYDVTESGNWFERMGHAPAGPKNILHITAPAEAFAGGRGMDIATFRVQLEEWRKKLYAVRAKRVAPALDDKILTGWNGLMIAGMAKGARVLNEPKYAEHAARAAEFVLDKLREDGRLLRTYRKGKARLTGYLSDYAFLVEGLINLYEATFDRKWLKEAAALTDMAIEYYFDFEGGAFFFTAKDAPKLLARSKSPHDGAIPSGNSVQALNLLRLSVLLNRKDYREKAESIFRAFAPRIEQSPGAFERLLCAVDFYHDRVKEIVIVGAPSSKDTQALVRSAFDRYVPNKVVVGLADAEPNAEDPLVKGKTRMAGRATAYVCENYRCKLPVTSGEELAKQLTPNRDKRSGS
jgi:hypothetical protein